MRIGQSAYQLLANEINSPEIPKADAHVSERLFEMCDDEALAIIGATLWRSATDDPPPIDTAVLVATSSGHVVVASRYLHVGYVYESVRWDCDDAAWWMPIPPIPAGEVSA